LCIADNGKGGVSEEGNGICGMRERVRALGGTLAFESERGKGTRVRIAVPLTAADRRLAPTTVPDALGFEPRPIS
jgi:two-component system sensor histidine kinase DesK